MKLRLLSEGEHKDAFGTHKWKTYAQIPTNADRIRAMTDEELAKTMLDCFAAFYDVEWSKKDILDWLKQEVKE